ncbi:hypothetical protein SAMN06298216_0282 [Spirosomataceae bacterium TFI 002]|nr:hypothetical protein SAMN06298216_0282 [Spirosomataceae bacterium TFI 002]
MVRKVVYLLMFSLIFFGCKEKDPDIDPNKPKLELISQNLWKLDRFSTPDGQMIQQNELNQEAILLFIMDFDFKSNFEVRGVERSSKTIIDRGVWKFINNEESINVKLTLLDYDFQIVKLTNGKLTLQAPTGNFLSVGEERINLEFSATQ